MTSPVTAKGIEDTALYIYNRLVSLNEVGGEPDHFGVAPDALHALAGRARRALAARAVGDVDARHQAQRGRARAAQRAVGAARRLEAGDGPLGARSTAAAARSIDGQSYPSRNEEYLLYQTLLGTWPLEPMTPRQEARLPRAHRRLHAQGDARGQGLHELAEPERAARAGDDALRRDGARAGQRRVPRRLPRRSSAASRSYGIYNSLAQLAIKIGAPGVPDFYQGTELWDFSLVDPDNRRPGGLRAAPDAARRARRGGRRAGGRASLAARLASTRATIA